MLLSTGTESWAARPPSPGHPVIPDSASLPPKAFLTCVFVLLGSSPGLRPGYPGRVPYLLSEVLLGPGTAQARADLAPARESPVPLALSMFWAAFAFSPLADPRTSRPGSQVQARLSSRASQPARAPDTAAWFCFLLAPSCWQTTRRHPSGCSAQSPAPSILPGVTCCGCQGDECIRPLGSGVLALGRLSERTGHDSGSPPPSLAPQCLVPGLPAALPSPVSLRARLLWAWGAHGDPWAVHEDGELSGASKYGQPAVATGHYRCSGGAGSWGTWTGRCRCPGWRVAV